MRCLFQAVEIYKAIQEGVVPLPPQLIGLPPLCHDRTAANNEQVRKIAMGMQKKRRMMGFPSLLPANIHRRITIPAVTKVRTHRTL